MFTPPNPVEAARNAMTNRLGPITTTPVQSEPMGTAKVADGHDDWDGRHCVFAYTYDTATNWPPCPTFIEEG